MRINDCIDLFIVHNYALLTMEEIAHCMSINESEVAKRCALLGVPLLPYRLPLSGPAHTKRYDIQKGVLYFGVNTPVDVRDVLKDLLVEGLSAQQIIASRQLGVTRQGLYETLNLFLGARHNNLRRSVSWYLHRHGVGRCAVELLGMFVALNFELRQFSIPQIAQRHGLEEHVFRRYLERCQPVVYTPPRIVVLPCAMCGKIMRVSRKAVERSRKKGQRNFFCSNECKGAAKRRQRKVS